MPFILNFRMRLLPVLLALTAVLSAQPKRFTANKVKDSTSPSINRHGQAFGPNPSDVRPPGLSKTPPNLTFRWLPSDDKKSAIVEFISTNKALLAPIEAAANALGIKVFDPKIHGKSEIENEFKRQRKDFDAAKFGRGH